MRDEQRKTAPPHARAAFEAATTAGWIEFVKPPPVAAVEDVLKNAPKLSRTDAELFALARDTGDDLFTDETHLSRVAEKHGVVVYDVVDTILLLEELGLIDGPAKKTLVLNMYAEDRTFTATELDALGLPGFL